LNEALLSFEPDEMSAAIFTQGNQLPSRPFETAINFLATSSCSPGTEVLCVYQLNNLQ
jgi:hypothetical protein